MSNRESDGQNDVDEVIYFHLQAYVLYVITSKKYRYRKIFRNYARKTTLMLMKSLMTSQRDDKIGLLYSCLNEIVTFSEIQVTVFSQSPVNLVHICSLVPHVGLSTY